MTTETKEIWKPVAGYEGIYDVSNLGRVKTVERTCYLNIKGTDTQRIIKEKIKHPSQDGQGYKNNNGYLSVILSFKTRAKDFMFIDLLQKHSWKIQIIMKPSIILTETSSTMKFQILNGLAENRTWSMLGKLV